MLGIDCATTTGWALVQLGAGRPVVAAHGTIRAGWHEVRDLVDHFSVAGLSVAALETPYVDKNADTTIKLARLCGRFEQELEARAIPVELVKASEWQRGLLRGLITETSKRGDRKRACRLWVKSELGKVVGEDEADAIALAVWVGRRLAFAARTAAAFR